MSEQTWKCPDCGKVYDVTDFYDTRLFVCVACYAPKGRPKSAEKSVPVHPRKTIRTPRLKGIQKREKMQKVSKRKVVYSTHRPRIRLTDQKKPPTTMTTGTPSKTLAEFSSFADYVRDRNEPPWIKKKRTEKQAGVDVDDFMKPTPIEFEKMCLSVFEKQGYNVEITPISGDSGIDGIATKGRTRIVIQCKQYAEHNKVGVREVREFKGAMAHCRTRHGYFITTSTFTADAKEFGSRVGIILIDKYSINDFLNGVLLSNSD